MEELTNKRKRFKFVIYKYSMNSLLNDFVSYEELNQKQLDESSERFNICLLKKVEAENTQDDCSLFSQILLQKYDNSLEALKEIYEKGSNKGGLIDELKHDIIYMDFVGTYEAIKEESTDRKNKILLKILDPENGGFIAHFKEDGNDIPVHFVPFLKSNSMSKNKSLSFIRKELRKPLLERLLLDLPIKKSLQLSRFYAYSGLSMSGGIKINCESPVLDLNNNPLGTLVLNEKSVVVIPDLTKIVDMPTQITMASNSMLKDLLKEIIYTKTFLSISSKEDNDIYCDTRLFVRKNIPSSMNNNDLISSGKDYLNNSLYPNIISCLNAFDIKKDDTQLPWNQLEIEKYFDDKINEKTYLNIFLKKDGRYDQLSKVIDEMLKDLGYDPSNLRKKQKAVGKIVTLLNRKKPVDCFDGEGLISPYYASLINYDYTDKDYLRKDIFHHSFQIRMPLTKGMLHQVDFYNFFNEPSISPYFIDINSEGVYQEEFTNLYKIDRNGYPVVLRAIIKDGKKMILDAFDHYRDIKDIQIILTTGQLKYNKIIDLSDDYKEDFMKAYFNHFHKYHHSLFITGSDSLDEEPLTMINYQFLSTSGLNKEEINQLCSPQIERAKKALTFDEETVKSIYQKSEYFRDVDEDEEEERILTKTDKIALALQKDFRLVNLSCVRSDVHDFVNEQARDVAIGHVTMDGELRYLASDILLLLYRIVGHDDSLPKEERIQKGQFYAPQGKFFDDEHQPLKCVLLRNPHISKNENTIAISWNGKDNSLREKYLKQLKWVIMINPTSLIQERLGGADYDGDECRIVSEKTFVDAVNRKIEDKPINDKDNILFNYQYGVGYVPTAYSTAIVPSFDNLTKKVNSQLGFDDNIAVNDTLLNTFGSKVGKYSDDGFKASCLAYSKDYINREDFANKVVEYYLTVGLEVDSAKSGTKPKEPIKLTSNIEEDKKNLSSINNSAIAFINNKNLIKTGAQVTNKRMEDSLNDANPVLQLCNIAQSVYLSDDKKRKNKGELSAIFKPSILDDEVTCKIISYISAFNDVTKINKINNNWDDTDAMRLSQDILKMNYGRGFEYCENIIHNFFINHSLSDKPRPDFAHLAILTDKEMYRYLLDYFSLKESELTLEEKEALYLLSKHSGQMSRIFLLLYRKYRNLDMASGGENDMDSTYKNRIITSLKEEFELPADKLADDIMDYLKNRDSQIVTKFNSKERKTSKDKIKKIISCCHNYFMDEGSVDSIKESYLSLRKNGEGIDTFLDLIQLLRYENNIRPFPHEIKPIIISIDKAINNLEDRSVINKIFIVSSDEDKNYFANELIIDKVSLSVKNPQVLSSSQKIADALKPSLKREIIKLFHNDAKEACLYLYTLETKSDTLLPNWLLKDCFIDELNILLDEREENN